MRNILNICLLFVCPGLFLFSHQAGAQESQTDSLQTGERIFFKQTAGGLDSTQFSLQSKKSEMRSLLQRHREQLKSNDHNLSLGLNFKNISLKYQQNARTLGHGGILPPASNSFGNWQKSIYSTLPAGYLSAQNFEVSWRLRPGTVFSIFSSRIGHTLSPEFNSTAGSPALGATSEINFSGLGLQHAGTISRFGLKYHVQAAYSPRYRLQSAILDRNDQPAITDACFLNARLSKEITENTEAFLDLYYSKSTLLNRSMKNTDKGFSIGILRKY